LSKRHGGEGAKPVAISPDNRTWAALEGVIIKKFGDTLKTSISLRIRGGPFDQRSSKL